MKKYKNVPGSEGQKRSFAVTVGLQEGYGENLKIYSIAEVINLAMEWMKSKAAQGLDFLTGTIVPGTVVYAWPDGPGQAGGGQEPNATFQGEISNLYSSHLTDEQVQDLLNDLASHLGGALGQTRVYVAYRDQTWVLQAEDSSTPTGETV